MRKKHISQFLFGIILLVGLNVVANRYFLRLDLTEDQRYSISPATKKILRNLQQDVYIKVYLEGEFPAGFKRLQKAVREALDEFKIYAGNKLNYRFIDPSLQGKDQKEKNQFYQQLVDKGISPTNLFVGQGDNRSEKLIFPGAIISLYDKKSGKSYETTAQLFRVVDQKLQSNLSPEQILNQSAENVEYNLISSLRQLTQENRKKIGFIVGHGELEDHEMASAVLNLRQYYEVVKVPLPFETKIKDGLDMIIVAKPDSTFSEEDKLKIDQFIMKGGKAMFFVDVVGLHMDSVIRDKGSFSFPIRHNLLDLFFRYGVRLNADLIKDLNAGLIPIVTGMYADNRPNIQPIPWQYNPLINTFSKHPIVKNMGPIQSKFISTIDTVKAQGIQKTPLLYTSQYSIVRSTPTFVRYEEERQRPDPRLYNQGPLAVAYLLEGKFNSLFKSRSQSQSPGFVAQSKPTKILVCSDGDLIKNDFDPQKQEPLPMGYDLIRRTSFSNADFLLNAVDYMIDEQGTILAKNKEIVLRPLDKIKLKEEKSYWQWFNMILPVILVVLFGIINYLIRNYKYKNV
ncbi:MAG: gliding motility-associated ABC transporter substrate-binding protein GldG [Microscillaceae bacterium]|nr:gliding motility-associated ABC transporter substrate-binding protein GldG [Microscillaceae bacterium]